MSEMQNLLSPALCELLQELVKTPEATYKELGLRLCRPPETVRTEFKLIYRKLKVKNQLAAVIRAWQLNLITLPPR